MRRRRTLALLAAWFLVAIGWSVTPAKAQSCSLSTAGVPFGTYDTMSSTDLLGVGTITMSCQNVAGGTPYEIALSQGNGSYSARRMNETTGQGYQLQYNLYSDSSRTIVWGDGTGGSSKVTGTAPLNLLNFTRDHSVYGRVPGAQKVGAGDYSDHIVVTLTVN